LSIDTIKATVASYPRQRVPLPEGYPEIMERERLLSRHAETFTTRLSQMMESWMHHQVAKGAGSVLELGAGTLNHLPYENSTVYDAVEPFGRAWADSPHLPRVRALYADTSDVPAANRYDRVISVAVLEHLTDLPGVLAEAALRLEDGGVFQHGIPSEGCFLWWAGLTFTTGIGFWLRNKMSVHPFMRHEHVNTARDIEAVIRYLFEEVTVRRFPLPWLHLSFYSFIEARRPRLERCHAILTDRANDST
jgi:SAM-dependent methyltransferase